MEKDTLQELEEGDRTVKVIPDNLKGGWGGRAMHPYRDCARQKGGSCPSVGQGECRWEGRTRMDLC